MCHDSASILTAPCTAHSAESLTTPTSISLSCPQSRTPSLQHHQTVLQTMQEKRATEMGTLLAALANAPQNTQSLRAENAKLVAGVEHFETELVDVRVQLRTLCLRWWLYLHPPRTTSTLLIHLRLSWKRRCRRAGTNASSPHRYHIVWRILTWPSLR